MHTFFKIFTAGALLILGAACGSNNTVIIPGTITLSSSPGIEVAASKFGEVPVDENKEEVELETKMTAEKTETADAVKLDITSLEAEGTLGSEGPVKVTLNPEGDSQGTVFKTDENDQPLGMHNFELDLRVEINGQSLEFNDVQVGGFTETIGLEVEVPPIEYRNGSDDIQLLKIPNLKKFVNVVLKRGSETFEDFPLEESP